MIIVRTDEEVQKVLDWAWENRGSQYPGMTYEEGLRAGIEWLMGYIDDDPTE